MNREKRLYELFFDKNTWMRRKAWVSIVFIIAPLIVGLITAEKCEYQKHVVKQKEGVYAK